MYLSGIFPRASAIVACDVPNQDAIPTKYLKGCIYVRRNSTEGATHSVQAHWDNNS